MLFTLGTPPGFSRRPIAPLGVESLQARRRRLSSCRPYPVSHDAPPPPAPLSVDLDKRSQPTNPSPVYLLISVLMSTVKLWLSPPLPPEPPDPPDPCASPALLQIAASVSRPLRPPPLNCRREEVLEDVSSSPPSICLRQEDFNLEIANPTSCLLIARSDLLSAQRLSSAGIAPKLFRSLCLRKLLVLLSGGPHPIPVNHLDGTSGFQTVPISGDSSGMNHSLATNVSNLGHLSKMGLLRKSSPVGHIFNLSPRLCICNVFIRTFEGCYTNHKALSLSSSAWERSLPLSSYLWERSLQAFFLLEKLLPSSSLYRERPFPPCLLSNRENFFPVATPETLFNPFPVLLSWVSVCTGTEEVIRLVFVASLEGKD